MLRSIIADDRDRFQGSVGSADINAGYRQNQPAPDRGRGRGHHPGHGRGRGQAPDGVPRVTGYGEVQPPIYGGPQLHGTLEQFRYATTHNLPPGRYGQHYNGPEWGPPISQVN